MAFIDTLFKAFLAPRPDDPIEDLTLEQAYKSGALTVLIQLRQFVNDYTEHPKEDQFSQGYDEGLRRAVDLVSDLFGNDYEDQE